MTPSFLSFVFSVLAAITTGAKPAPVRPVQLMSQQEMEARVRLDVSRVRQVKYEEVQVTATTAQTWPDDRLGCASKREAVDPKPTPGFRIIAKSKRSHLTYHTDRNGRVLRCEPPAKPAKRASPPKRQRNRRK